MAAVTINALTHEGLTDMAIGGTQKYEKAQSDEMNMLNYIDAMVKETVKNIENGTTIPPATPDEPTPPTTPDFSEIIALVSDNIGASSDYQTPKDRTYSTKIDNIEYSGYSSGNPTFNSNDISFTWKIWNIDSNNIYLISDKATNKGMRLTNYAGYNNGVTLLDNLCNTLYADTATYSGMVGRNIKVEDIINTRILKDLTSNNTKNTLTNYQKQPCQCNFAYPYIWAEYEQNEDQYLANRSTAYTLTTSNQTTESLNVKPWGSLWENTNMNQSSFKAIGSDNGATLYNLVMGAGLGSSGYYWFSSRYANPTSSGYCEFGLQGMGSGGIRRSWLYYSENYSIHYESPDYAVRPLVQIPLTSCEITKTGDTFHIAPKG